jgi:hypothetical protein
MPTVCTSISLTLTTNTPILTAIPHVTISPVCSYWAQWLTVAWSNGWTCLGKTATDPTYEMSCFCKQLDSWCQLLSVVQWRDCQVMTVVLCSAFWLVDTWRWNWCVPRTPVTAPCCVISQRCADLTWRFGDTGLGSALYGPVQSKPVWCFICELMVTSHTY